jgi:hypothetical protein
VNWSRCTASWRVPRTDSWPSMGLIAEISAAWVTL